MLHNYTFSINCYELLYKSENASAHSRLPEEEGLLRRIQSVRTQHELHLEVGCLEDCLVKGLVLQQQIV